MGRTVVAVFDRQLVRLVVISDTRHEMATLSPDEIAEHYATFMATLPSRLIVIGHSFGRLLAEKLLGDGHAVAGVGIDAEPIKGVLPLPISRCGLPSWR